MIIPLKDREKDCWKAWIDHYNAQELSIDAELRTKAFINSKNLTYPR